MEKRISLSTAALRLGLSYHQAREKLLRGELPGGQDKSGRFFVLASGARKKQLKSVRSPKSSDRQLGSKT